MFKDLMHNILGGSSSNGAIAAGAFPTGAQGMANSSTYPSAGQIASQYNRIMQKDSVPKSKKIFHGTVEVLQVANGYIVNIGRKEGYEYETYIAETITDVNERIAAAIVAFQLEGK